MSWAWASAFGGMAAGVGLTLLGQSIVYGLKIPDGVGGLLGGCAAISSAAFAWQGFTRWETRHRKERQAQVASEALVAALDLSDLLRSVANEEYEYDPDYGSLPPDELYSELATRLGSSALVERFAKVRTQVEAFLGNDARELVHKLWELRNEQLQKLGTACHYHVEDDSHDSDEAYAQAKTVLGDKMVQRIAGQIADTKKCLRRYAMVE